MGTNLPDTFLGATRTAVESVLTKTIKTQRWFGGKAREIAAVTLVDAIPLASCAMAVVEVAYRQGSPERCFWPLSVERDAATAELRLGPQSVLGRLSTEGPEVLADALGGEIFGQELLRLVERDKTAPGAAGSLAGIRAASFAALRGDADEELSPRLLGGEQSNTSLVFGNRLILKLFRRLEEGPNPDLELGHFLTDKAGFAYVPQVAGSIEYHREGRPAASVAVLQQLVPNHGDAWKHTLACLDGYFSQLTGNSATAEFDNLSLSPQLVDSYRPNSELLGRRTAELHLALGSNSLDPDFMPVAYDEAAQDELAATVDREASATFQLLSDRREHLPPQTARLADLAISRRDLLIEQLAAIKSRRLESQKIRVHGDYHLGQVLYTGVDFMILDFEGEPARPLAERRAKQSPLKDVAGMLRSFDYAVAVARGKVDAAAKGIEPKVLDLWATEWRDTTSAAYLRGYEEEIRGAGFMPADPAEFSLLLKIHLLEKALYELRYELNNRPDWVSIPLSAIVELSQSH